MLTPPYMIVGSTRKRIPAIIRDSEDIGTSPGIVGLSPWPWYTRASAKPIHIPILTAFDRADGGLDLESHDVHNLRGSTSLTEDDDERDTRSIDSSGGRVWGPGRGRGRDVIDRSTRGPVAILRLAHGKASALDVELLRALSQALDEASASRALVLTGTGHIFSAGLELFRLLEGGEAYMRELLPTLSATLAKVMRVWTNPETRDAVRRYVERALGARA